MKLFSATGKKLVTCCVLFAFLFTYGFAFAAADTEVDYNITSPYTALNWDTVSQYKGDLHCHTTASDGSNTLVEMVEKHYELGYDFLAVTDHGTVDYNWTDGHVDPDLKIAISVKDGEIAPVVPLQTKGTAANGNTYTLSDNGTDTYYTQFVGADAGKTMLRVPLGIEQNPASFNNCHVNSWFTDYGDGKLSGTSDYRTPMLGIQNAGGVCVINHPGEYTSARDEVYAADAYNRDNFHYRYVINKFESLLLEFDTCIGIDINSKGDWRTRFDRKLWDALLTDLTPAGRSVYAIATSDAHNLDIVNSGYTLALMEENTGEALRACLTNGTFFAASRYIGNVEELRGYAAALTASDTAAARAFGDTLGAIVAKIDAEIAAGEQSTKFEAAAGQAAPVITSVSVDDAADTITLAADNALLVSWIADGKVIATGNSIDLDDYSDAIGSYVRAEVLGKGGIVYTQAFTLSYDGAPQDTIDRSFFDYGTTLGRIIQFLIELITLSPLFDMIWELAGK